MVPLSWGRGIIRGLPQVCQAGASNYQQRAIIITRPDFASVTTRITVGGELTNHANAGLVLHNSGTGRILQWLVHLHGPGKDLELHRANSFTSFDSAITTTGVRVGVGHVYLRMTSDGTSIQRWVSGDGIMDWERDWSWYSRRSGTLRNRYHRIIRLSTVHLTLIDPSRHASARPGGLVSFISSYESSFPCHNRLLLTTTTHFK